MLYSVIIQEKGCLDESICNKTYGRHMLYTLHFIIELISRRTSDRWLVICYNDKPHLLETNYPIGG